MTIEALFYTQIAAIISFVFVVFTLYRLLVRAKDATIESYKTQIENQKVICDALKAHIIYLESLNKTLADQKPDVLLQRLEKRSASLQKELQEAENEQANFQIEIDHLRMTLTNSEKALEIRLNERTQSLADVIMKLADANERLSQNLKHASDINEAGVSHE